MSSDPLPDTLPDQDTKLTIFEREQLTIAEYLLRPLLSKLKLALLAMPPTHPCFDKKASKRNVIAFLDEYFDNTEIPFTDNKAPVYKQYEDVKIIMQRMDKRIELLERVSSCEESSFEVVKADLEKAIGWWRQALPKKQKADRDPDQISENERCPEHGPEKPMDLYA